MSRRMGPYMILLMLLAVAGTRCEQQESDPQEEPAQHKEPVNGIRLAWDYRSLQKLAPADERNLAYCGYSRMIQKEDGTLVCVYETSAGNTEVIQSTDTGRTWTPPRVLFEMNDQITQSVPDIIELDDGSLLAACNPRPREVSDSESSGERRFGIKLRKSTDGVENWGPEQVVYQAGTAFENGCWEPAFMQLPSGEVHLYFSNEGPYTYSNEQEISLLRSYDSGTTWSDSAETVSFRNDRRDGMPVPLYLDDREEILVAIEDNGYGEFKPSILRTTLQDNWQGTTLGGSDPRREYALDERLDPEIYAGGPFITRLSSGEVLLSYQSLEGRTGRWDQSAMVVAIGDQEGKHFNRKTWPFKVPLGKWGLWNSLAVWEGNVPVALSSTNAYSSGPTEVWMIRGRVIPELEATRASLLVDGQANESLWQNKLPLFIGSQSPTNLSGRLAWDDQYLYLALQVSDAEVHEDSDDPLEEDGVEVRLDPQNQSFDKPDEGIFSLVLSSGGKILFREGKRGTWKERDVWEDLQTATQKTDFGYIQEIAFPWEMLGEEAAVGMHMRLHLTMREDTNGGNIDILEHLGSNDPDASYTWSRLTLKGNAIRK